MKYGYLWLPLMMVCLALTSFNIIMTWAGRVKFSRAIRIASVLFLIASASAFVSLVGGWNAAGDTAALYDVIGKAGKGILILYGVILAVNVRMIVRTGIKKR